MDTKWQAQMGYTPLLTRGIIAVKGVDAEKFLQGQLTVNLNTITPNLSQLAAHCNLKGRMQALFRVIKVDSDNPEYRLLAPKEIIPIAIKNLKKYALFSKVTIDELNDVALFGLGGEQAQGALNTLHNLPDITFCEIPGKLKRFEIMVANSRVDDLKGLLKQATLINENDWERLDIEAGIPSIYPATLDALLPHHVNLTELGGISFDKGCYLGQEIVARMHYRGKIKRHMYLGALENSEESPCPGDQVVIVDAPNEAPGIVVRASQTDNGFVLLVVLDEQHANFENIRFKKADGPKLHRLNLAY